MARRDARLRPHSQPPVPAQSRLLEPTEFSCSGENRSSIRPWSEPIQSPDRNKCAESIQRAERHEPAKRIQRAKRIQSTARNQSAEHNEPPDIPHESGWIQHSTRDQYAEDRKSTRL